MPCPAIDSRGRFAIDRLVSLAQLVNITDMVQERCEPLSSILSCCLAYPFERVLRTCPALGPVCVTLRRISLGQFPFLHRLRHSPASFVRQLLRSTELSDFPYSFIIVLRPWTSQCALHTLYLETNMGSPGSRAQCFRTCQGLRPRRVQASLAIATRPVLPST